MQSSGLTHLNIIGGTYLEECLDPIWKKLFGSGLRSLELVKKVFPTLKVDFYTGSKNRMRLLKSKYCNKYITLHAEVESDISFRYVNPFHLDFINNYPKVQAKMELPDTDNVVAFGMLEAQSVVNCKKCVYDPQSSSKCFLFSRSGSNAEKLVYVLNKHEAETLSNQKQLEKIADFFFKNENCYALIVKDGPHGAHLFMPDKSVIEIPVYFTSHSFTIGSGDIFTTAFALRWMDNGNLKEAANYASLMVAKYSNNAGNIDKMLADKEYSPEFSKRKGKVYLAGPFFNRYQKILLFEVNNALESSDIQVFLPMRDAGTENPKDYASRDLKGIDESDVVMAICEDIDSGTLFEMGYAYAKGKKIVVLTSKTANQNFDMLSGLECEIESDFTTAIYKACWYAER